MPAIQQTAELRRWIWFSLKTIGITFHRTKPSSSFGPNAKDDPNEKRAGDHSGPLIQVVYKLKGTISTDEMRKLNYEVDGAKRDKKIVVHEWLVKKGFVQ